MYIMITLADNDFLENFEEKDNHKYTSIRIINGKPRKVIVNEKGDIANINPNKEELIGLKIEPYKFGTGIYNYTNTCEFIETNGERCIEKLYPKNANRVYQNGKRIWCCNTHCSRHRDKLPNSKTNLQKSLCGRRTGYLNPNCPSAKGDLAEELTNIWRGTKNLNKELDCYNTAIDHSRDPEFGTITTKSARFNNIYGKWHNGNIGNEQNKNIDNLIFHCFSSDGMIHCMTYVIHKTELINHTSITIYKNNPNRYPWFEQYRITNEDEITKIEEIWKNIIKKIR